MNPKNIDDTQPIRLRKPPKRITPQGRTFKHNEKGMWISLIFMLICVFVLIFSGVWGWRANNLTTSKATNAESCSVYHSSDRGQFDFKLIISGKKQKQVWVDVYLPKQSRPAEVSKRYNKSFSDTGDSYILQTYSSYDWDPGFYRLTWKLGAKNGESSIRLGNSDNRVDVWCD